MCQSSALGRDYACRTKLEQWCKQTGELFLLCSVESRGRKSKTVLKTP